MEFLYEHKKFVLGFQSENGKQQWSRCVDLKRFAVQKLEFGVNLCFGVPDSNC